MEGKRECPYCEGTGKEWDYAYNSEIGEEVRVVLDDPCEECGGTGFIQDTPEKR
ncbi:hypothetical protein [Lihuaxuella thermophila]|uniref:Uncharacterized protein n=1 Tax=Lihuaxuella thermophila TaxID=1173111 RepID=A0A1H8JB50_9BACL|nr:hypothetical protein [Lihuaxuella thermophila]SEN53575.1 hypothetical protein SAMN05444955_113133 [Lihuaxuella thermophila]SEN78010.1 hypothetical protein SAMN05444955_12326 [Lihuaxuella thermophila]SEN80573.1 hypothetical protein SAMN05444955_12616 [Lihuaxuella thermophila]